MAKYLITKDYAKKLRNKIHQFKESSKTRNTVFLNSSPSTDWRKTAIRGDMSSCWMICFVRLYGE
jgi:hypothetical protein